MIFRMFLDDVVIISNKVNNYLYRTYHSNVRRTLLLLLMLLCWIQASYYWLGTIIQKTSIEKSYEKHLNNDFQCFHTLKVICKDSIRGLSNFNETKIFKKRFAEQLSVVQALILELKTDNFGLFLFCLVQISMT